MCVVLSGSLERNKTYAKRSWTYVQLPGQQHPVLTITQQRSPRAGAAVDVESYAVEVDTSEHPACLGFILHKQGEPDTFYNVVLGPVDRCTCDAGRYGLDCKHVAALRGMLEQEAGAEPVDTQAMLDEIYGGFDLGETDPGERIEEMARYFGQNV